MESYHFIYQISNIAPGAQWLMGFWGDTEQVGEAGENKVTMWEEKKSTLSDTDLLYPSLVYFTIDAEAC